MGPLADRGGVPGTYDAIVDRRQKSEDIQHVSVAERHILTRFQLRCLKQGDMQLKEFITKARTLVNNGGYDDAV